MTLNQLEKRFPTEESCRQYLMETRWPGGEVFCPRCRQTKKVYALKARPFHWVCKNESEECPGVYRFSVLTGTIYENTNVPLRLWFKVIYLMTVSKKGISALQVRRMLDPVRGKTGSYRTAWYMCHRIRAAMLDGEMLGKLAGEVEIDETHIGGKDRNRHWKKKSQQARDAAGYQRPGHKVGYLKVPVIGAIARKGNVVCQVVGNLNAESKAEFVRQAVSERVSLVATDEDPAFNYVRPGMPHETVSHSRGEYVRGNVHTNNIESFWSLLKRGVVGTFHNISKEYLPLYLNEFSFRHNNRDNPDIFGAVVAGC